MCVDWTIKRSEVCNHIVDLHPFSTIAQGMLVPTIGDHDTLDLQSIKWICVIEKEVPISGMRDVNKM